MNYTESIDYIKSIIGEFEPEVGVVLGSGLGGFAEHVEVKYSIDYCDIPSFPVSTVEGHDGKLIFGFVGVVPVLVMKGRFHYYEGYTSQTIAYPIRVMRLLGVKTLLLSNAAGGINPDYKVGDLVIIKNHINLIPNPLIGKNDNSFGVRFPEMKQPYSNRLIDIALSKYELKTGVYVAVTGPSYETSAEIKYFGLMGGDLVGMSTAPEAIVAVHCGIEVFAMSVVTNSAGVETSHEEVVSNGDKATKEMIKIFKHIIECKAYRK